MPHYKKLFMESQQEIVEIFPTIVGQDGSILCAAMKTRESLQDWIQRKDREMQGTLIDGRPAGHPALAARAKRKGHKISAGYLDNLANGTATNPSRKLIKAVAAAYAAPLVEVIAVT